MACQVEKLEIDVHIKASAEHFYDVFCSRTHHVGNICPEKYRVLKFMKVNGAPMDPS
ncbi:START-like domain superfamily [Sesbania bispinosa]|nr:START-like domain superfamily [Sesbania bispinosa]